MESTMNFGLTEEQIMFRDTVRAYCDEHVRPVAAEREWIVDPVERIPYDWIEDLSKMGVRTMGVPEEYGGPGADTITVCTIVEEISAADLSLGVILDQTIKFIPLITTACSDEQRERFLPAFMADDRYLLAVGLHEDDAGSDHFLPYNEPPHGAKMTAVQDGDDWILNGRKSFISMGGVADLSLVFARSQPGTGGINGLTGFFIEKGMAGYTAGRVENKLGQRMVHNGEIILEDCRVPAANVLGDPGGGLGPLARHLRGRGYPEAASTTLGVAREAYERALEHARTHVQGGTEIINHDIIALMLVDMDTKIETARLLIRRAAWAADHAEQPDLRLVSMAKQYASEVAVDVCVRAMEVFGGAGYMMDLPMQKYIRDTLSFLHSEGTNQIMLLRQANLLRRGIAPPF